MMGNDLGEGTQHGGLVPHLKMRRFSPRRVGESGDEAGEGDKGLSVWTFRVTQKVGTVIGHMWRLYFREDKGQAIALTPRL